MHIYFLFYVLLIVYIFLNSLKDKCTIFTSEVYCFYQDFLSHSIFSDNITTWLLVCFIAILTFFSLISHSDIVYINELTLVLLVTQCTIVLIRKNIGSIKFISGEANY